MAGPVELGLLFTGECSVDIYWWCFARIASPPFPWVLPNLILSFPYSVFSQHIWCQPFDSLSPTCILLPSANFISLSRCLPLSQTCSNSLLKLFNKPCLIVHYNPLMLPLRFCLLSLLPPWLQCFLHQHPSRLCDVLSTFPHQLISSGMPLHTAAVSSWCKYTFNICSCTKRAYLVFLRLQFITL